MRHLVLFLILLIVGGCGSSNNVMLPTDYVDGCGPDAILIGDICVPRNEFSKEQLAKLMQRTEKELECESKTAAGVTIEDMPEYCKAPNE